jgi:hypothetical protein
MRLCGEDLLHLIRLDRYKAFLGRTGVPAT